MFGAACRARIAQHAEEESLFRKHNPRSVPSDAWSTNPRSVPSDAWNETEDCMATWWLKMTRTNRGESVWDAWRVQVDTLFSASTTTV